MKVFLLTISLCLTIWYYFWWQAATEKRIFFHKWMNEKIVNIEKKYDNVSTSGFPNRIDLKIKKFQTLDLINDWSIYISSIQIMELVYQKNKYIISLQAPFDLIHKDLKLNVPTGQIKVSIDFSKGKKIEKLIFESSSLNFNSNKNFKGNFSGIVGGMKLTDDTSNKFLYDFVITINELDLTSAKSHSNKSQFTLNKFQLNSTNIKKLNKLDIVRNFIPNIIRPNFKDFKILVEKITLDENFSSNHNNSFALIENHWESLLN